MQGPRIYTYKVTFPAQGWWYWGVHKERVYGESYRGSPKTHKDKWKWFRHEIEVLEFFDNWDEARAVERRLIAADLNNPMCLNENCGGALSLQACSIGGATGAGGRANANSPDCARRNPEIQSNLGKKGGRKHRGKAWFNDGINEILTFSPPPHFEPGRLPTKLVWWTNGEQNVRSTLCPSGFRRGRTLHWKTKNQYSR